MHTKIKIQIRHYMVKGPGKKQKDLLANLWNFFWQFSSRIDGLYSLYYVHYRQKWQEKAYIHMYVTITT